MKRKKAAPADAALAAANAAIAAQEGTPAKSGKKRRGGLAARRQAAQQQQEPDSDSSSSPDDGAASDEDGLGEDAGEEVEVDFDFVDPDEEDYHGVKMLLQGGSLDFLNLNLSELTDSIVNQGNIGTLVKSSSPAVEKDDEATVCAMLTVLNLRQFAKQSWPKAIQQSLLAVAHLHAEAGAAKKLEALFKSEGEGQEVGLLLAQRFGNIPSQLIPALHTAVLEDITWSCETPECPAEERPFYFFGHFISISRCYLASEAADVLPEVAAATRTKVGGIEVVFPNAEDESYAKRASLAFTFPLTEGAATAVAASSQGSSLTGTLPTGKKRRKAALKALSASAGKGEDDADDQGGSNVINSSERRAVFVLPRKAFEQAAAELQKRVKEP